MLLPSHSFEFKMNGKRRDDLRARIKAKYPSTDGAVMFIAGFESDRSKFWQESSFYYYTGIVEPAVVFMQNIDGESTLYTPNCVGVRKQWVYSPIELSQHNAQEIGIDVITELGDKCAGFQLFPFFKPASYQNIINRLQQLVKQQKKLFTLYPNNEHEYVEQRLVLNRLMELIPDLKNHVIDISAIVADMRRSKDTHEIDMLCKAVSVTELAQEAAANAIESGIRECEVQASLEYMMTGAGCRPAFPSIVASGKHGTILHYQENENTLEDGQLVVVDIGASYQGYCADITRTYPVSGKFTDRQLELYNKVLEVQEYIADIVRPGFYLNNPDHPKKSLQHLAKEHFEQYGLAEYFVHGIGHYLGLDVHDVGNPREPLRENDVITIEPGVYLPGESIGIRIEDNYWIRAQGAICLSDNLPKSPERIQELVTQNFSPEDDHDEDEHLGVDEFMQQFSDDDDEDFGH